MFYIMNRRNPDWGRDCPACGQPLQEGQQVVVVPLGPGANEAERKKMLSGQPYKPVGIQVHLACADVRYRS